MLRTLPSSSREIECRFYLSLLRDLPLHERGIRMVFEDRLNRNVERRILHRVAEQITDHADVASLGQFDHRDDIGTRLLERRMDRIPASHPAKQTAASRQLMPTHIE